MIFSLLGQALVGWLIADLIGGFVHWWEDRIGRPRWAWLERHVFEPNRHHHVEPMAFTEQGFLSRNSTAFLAATVIAIIWLSVFGFSTVLLFAFLGGALQNEVHYLAHKRPGGSKTHKPGRFAGWLSVFQQIGLIQSVPSHAKHHLPPQNKNYCVLTDWCNPVLEYLDVWNRLERRLNIKDQENG